MTSGYDTTCPSSCPRRMASAFNQLPARNLDRGRCPMALLKWRNDWIYWDMGTWGHGVDGAVYYGILWPFARSPRKHPNLFLHFEKLKVVQRRKVLYYLDVSTIPVVCNCSLFVANLFRNKDNREQATIWTVPPDEALQVGGFSKGQ